MIRAPISTIIFKTAAPCNLNCTYCYEYNRGDSSWKSKPPSVALELCAILGQRIRDYCGAAGISQFGVTLHGGEPMLAGPAKIARIIDEIRLNAAPIKIRMGMQTNATLTTPAMLEVLASRKVNVGVSLDGDDFANRNRVDHRGELSRDRTVAGIAMLRSVGLLSGIQAVIDLDSEPGAVLDALADFDPPLIELGIPFGNHDNPPHSGTTRYSLGAWMVAAFGHWVSSPRLSGRKVRILQDALTSIINEKSTSDWFPAVPPGYLVVATDGSYEGLDPLKVAGAAGRVLNLKIQDDPIVSALDHPAIVARSSSSQLCSECRACAMVQWCHGGYYPTRYGRGRDFDNPSVYCADFKQLFSGLGNWLLAQGNTPEDVRHRISAKLKASALS